MDSENLEVTINPEEIHFLVDEIGGKLNKEIESIIFELQNPQARKKLRDLRIFTKMLMKVKYLRKKEEMGKIRRAEDEYKRLQLKEGRRKMMLLRLNELRLMVEELKMKEQKVVEEKEEEKVEVIHVPLIMDVESGNVIVYADVVDDNYKVIEPELSENDANLLSIFKENFDRLAAALYDRKRLARELMKVAKEAGFGFELHEYLKFKYFIVRDMMSLGRVEPLLHDKKIHKIICEGPNREIIVIREGEKIRTNVMFDNADELNRFVTKIGEATFHKVSLDEPVLDAVYKNFRVQATLGSDVVEGRFFMSRV